MINIPHSDSAEEKKFNKHIKEVTEGENGGNVVICKFEPVIAEEPSWKCNISKEDIQVHLGLGKVVTGIITITGDGSKITVFAERISDQLRFTPITKTYFAGLIEDSEGIWVAVNELS